MARMDFKRGRLRDQLRAIPIPIAEVRNTRATETAKTIAGMGNGRFSKAADKFMGAEPVTRIDPNSPQGRAIAAKLGL